MNLTLGLSAPRALSQELRAGPSGFPDPCVQGASGRARKLHTPELPAPLLAGVWGSRGLASRKGEGRYAATGSAERKVGAPERAESVRTRAQ